MWQGSSPFGGKQKNGFPSGIFLLFVAKLYTFVLA